MKENLILKKSKEFSLSCIRLYKKLQSEREYIISQQMLRSATSIGANVHEADGGQSKKDFYAKMCIAYKEARETLYWLELLEESDMTSIDISEQKNLCQEILRILYKIKISTQESI